ncbi:ATPase, AAA family [Ostertagia ostertagi]
MSVIKPRCIMKGFVVQFEKWDEYLPPDTCGLATGYGSAFHAFLSNGLLGINARQPVRVQTPVSDYIGVVWPCKEIGILRISLTEENGAWEKLACITPIWNSLRLQRISLSIDSPLPLAVASLQEYYTVISGNRRSSLSCFIDRRNAHSEEDFDGFCSSSISEGKIMLFYIALDCRELAKNIVAFRCCQSSWKLSVLFPNEVKARMYRISQIPSCFQSMDEFSEKYTLIPPRCVVILDWPSVDKEHKGFSKLVQLIDNQCAAVVLSVRQAEELDLGVRVRFPVERGIVLSRWLKLMFPMEEERIEILRSLTGSSDDVIVDLAKRTHGFTGGDLKSLVVASRFTEGQTESEKLENARKRVRPTGIRQFILEVPHVSWDDIGGSEELKLEIQQAVIWPQKHRDAFERFGIDPPSGILLYGPPGCSKTLVARALASESKMNFLAVKGPELFSKWVGESEKAIRDLFSRARQVAPTIVFFDEIDAVGSSRGSEKSSGVSDRVLAQLLTELDGLEKQSGVLLLAATNRPDQLDSALLRPGRLDRAIYVGLPCSKTRRAIIEMRTKRMTLAEDDIIEKLVNKTEGYSGAELVAVCRQAALLAMRENINATEVRWQHFEETLLSIVPRTERHMLEAYERFKRGVV